MDIALEADWLNFRQLFGERFPADGALRASFLELFGSFSRDFRAVQPDFD